MRPPKSPKQPPPKKEKPTLTRNAERAQREKWRIAKAVRRKNMSDEERTAERKRDKLSRQRRSLKAKIDKLHELGK